MYSYTHYKLDFDKIKTIEDVIEILKVLDPAMEHYTPNITNIHHLIKEVKKEDSFHVMD